MATCADSTEAFRELCRRYSRAQRMYDSARSTDGSVERREAALSMKQALEAEFLRCFRQIASPDWARVEAAAAGAIS